MKLDELRIYQLSMKMGDVVWDISSKWDYFSKETVGKQLVRAADSVAANISEGYGRYHFKENRYFNFIARGSLFETKTWMEKASKRGLIEDVQFQQLRKEINELAKMLNEYIKKIGPVGLVKEPQVIYRNQLNEYEIPEEETIHIDELPFPDLLTNDY